MKSKVESESGNLLSTSHAEALAETACNKKGTQFDPEVVDTFVREIVSFQENIHGRSGVLNK